VRLLTGDALLDHGRHKQIEDGAGRTKAQVP